MITLAIALLSLKQIDKTVEYQPIKRVQEIREHEKMAKLIQPIEPLPIPEPPISTYTEQSTVKMPVKTITGNLYIAGNCTWYVKSRRPDLPNDLGNADTWYARAAYQGYAVGYSPRVGAVAAAIGYMHVAIVTAIHGSSVTIIEMNYQGYGIVSSREAPTSEFRYIY